MIKQYFLLVAISIVICQLTFAKTIKVSTNSQIAEANKSAIAGDTIILQNGEWKDCDLLLTCNGSAIQPIVIKAEVAGKVMITGKSNLHIGGNYIIVSGLEFVNGQAAEGDVWQLRAGKTVANYCRVTNCVIRDFNNPKRLDENYWVALYGQHNRIDHCTFSDKKNLGVLMAVILDDDRSRQNSHSIDSNNFAGRIPLASNAGEIIRVGVSQHCTFYSNTVIKDNVFAYCDGEAEIISIKSCGNIIRNNVFQECQGSLSLRHGNNNTVEGNIFLGNGKEGTGGVRIINEGNWVINNLFYKCRGVNFRSPLAIMNGVFNSPAFRYLPVRDAVVANNTFINCTPFSLCEGSDSERTVSPKNVYFFNNIFLNKKDTTLYEVFDNIDSIYFYNNIADKAVKQLLTKGFTKQEVSIEVLKSTPFSIAVKSNPQLDSIKQMAVDRLAYGLPTTVGFTRWVAFTATQKDAYNGKGYKAEDMGKWTAYPPHNDTTINCANTADIYKAMKVNKEMISIVLTGNNYHFTSPIETSRAFYIYSQHKHLIKFSSAAQMPAIFIVKAGSVVSLFSLKIDGKAVKANSLFLTDTTGSSNHYTFGVNDCTFSNFGSNNGCNHIFNASKYVVADNINFQNCHFNNNSCNLFTLNNETDNKGYYSVETMHVSYCQFTNNNGSMLTLYRGGSDESTMGPKLTFNNNKIINCNNNGELIKLTGVQQSYFTNNSFVNANKDKTIISYTDKVRALHEQNNNQLMNSGSVETNKFVVNVK
ncbi:polysaccharide lyase 6 family protein [Parasediminibacterium paludis]|uniref:Polysaccharide lyase 6 family protein n=1 Tax=Parasediminibacterium paludis TaxID=908966 RepID=A0ABV8PWQ0_9BACT